MQPGSILKSLMLLLINSDINFSLLDGQRGLHYTILNLSKPFVKSGKVTGKSAAVFATSIPVTTVSSL